MIRCFRFSATPLGVLLLLPAFLLAQEETQTVTGELAACYVGQDLSNEEHLACANLCMELATPMVLVAEDGHVYVPTGSDASQLSAHANELVEIQGAVGEQAECRTIAVEEMKSRGSPIPEGRSGKAYTSRVVTEEDLAQLPNMSLYRLLRDHSYARIVDYPQYGEIIACEERETRGTGGRYRGCGIYVDERRVLDPIATARELNIHEIERLEILRRSEASNRYGGHGYNGLIVIRTRSKDASGS